MQRPNNKCVAHAEPSGPPTCIAMNSELDTDRRQQSPAAGP